MVEGRKLRGHRFPGSPPASATMHVPACWVLAVAEQSPVVLRILGASETEFCISKHKTIV
jgi:hypothetical protein